ncbi:glycosyltransferase family 4 protein [Mucilaginibacter sp. dw_454]|uniref:glycosyltransferase family 4 protein n=1 Tax=Mucilaginibacter sp. dw_454 TaxID=2720079 RepID=UPI001BD4AA4F|nr:glycosyltransferase family 4 protein [Mucilaginibacter sp. dw_454]
MRNTLIILTPGFPENEADTTCLPDRQIFLRVLRDTYPDLNIVVLSFQYPFQSREYYWEGIRIIALGGKGKGGVPRRVIWYRAWKKLKQLHKENEVIGLLSFWLDECAFIAHMFSERYKLPNYAWILGQDARAGNRFVHRISADGSNLIALSQFLIDEFEKNYGFAPQHLVASGINPAMYGTPPAKRDIDILGAGFLIPLKQYHLLVETVKMVKTRYPNVRAVLCGKGPELDNLLALVRQYGLEDNIEFTGEITHAETLAMMQRTKVFLHPSAYEGFGTVLLESLYAGAHLISFLKPMKKSFDHHYVVADVNEMAQTTLNILMDENRDHEPVLIQSVTQMAEAIMELYRPVLHSEEAMS